MVAAAAWPWTLLYAHLEHRPGLTLTIALRLEAPPQSLLFDNAGIQVGPRKHWRTAFARVHVIGVPEGSVAAAGYRV